MKKLVLTSLMAVFAVSGAHAANVINNNPLYRPEAGQFYSVTSVGSSSEEANRVGLEEEFGYGITNRLSAGIATSATQNDWFESAEWEYIGVGLNFRALDMGNWKSDLFASYGVGNVLGYKSNDGKNTNFLDKDFTGYQWTAGVRGGYVGDGWTVAGHVAFDYSNTESFNWSEGFKLDEETDHHYRISEHALRFGLDGQLVLNEYWNLIAGVEYNADYDNWSENVGYWTGKLGANFNFDSDKFIGVFVTKQMNHVAEESGKWEVADGFGFGATFGIQF